MGAIIGAIGGITHAIMGTMGRATGAMEGTIARAGACRSIGGHIADDKACRGVMSGNDGFVEGMKDKLRGTKGACASFRSCMTRQETRVHTRIIHRVYAATSHVSSRLKGIS